MAKGPGKGKRNDASKKDKGSKKDDRSRREAAKRSRVVPIKTPVHEPRMREISALRSFITSFVFFALILAPVLGLGLYFGWDIVIDYFPTEEDAFMGGMAVGVGAAFVIAVLFARKTVATS